MQMGAVKYGIFSLLNLYLPNAHFKRVMALAAVFLHVLYALEPVAVTVFTFIPVRMLFLHAA